MGLIMRRNLMGGKALPYLRRVAYLESHGTEIINLGYTLEKQYRIVASVEPYGTGGTLFSTSGGVACSWIRADQNDNGFVFTVGSGTFTELKSGIVLINHQFLKGSDYQRSCISVVDQAELVRSASTSYLPGNTVTLFGSESSRCFARLYYADLKNELDNSVIKLIPVLDLSGRPCMYNQEPSDIPTDDPSRFFYNQGTGEFTWGEIET